MIGKEAYKGNVNKDKEPYQSRMGRIVFEVFLVGKQLVCTESKNKNSSKDEHKGNQIDSKISQDREHRIETSL